jgi:hypothetical protein
MRSGDAVPSVGPQASFSELMREISSKGLGAPAVVDDDRRVLGIFTDGDLRRLVEQGQDLRALRAADVMHTQPRTVQAQALAVEASRSCRASFGARRAINAPQSEALSSQTIEAAGGPEVSERNSPCSVKRRYQCRPAPAPAPAPAETPVLAPPAPPAVTPAEPERFNCSMRDWQYHATICMQEQATPSCVTGIVTNNTRMAHSTWSKPGCSSMRDSSVCFKL